MKNKNTVLSVVIIVLFVGGLILIASPNNSPADTNQRLTANMTFSANENFFDFGEISMASGPVNHVFKVKNQTDKPVEISKIYTSCMCTTASIKSSEKEAGPFGMPGHGFVPLANVVIEPGEEFEILATFNPGAHGPAGVGRNNRTVYVETDSGNVLEFNFTALVTP